MLVVRPGESTDEGAAGSVAIQGSHDITQQLVREGDAFSLGEKYALAWSRVQQNTEPQNQSHGEGPTTCDPVGRRPTSACDTGRSFPMHAWESSEGPVNIGRRPLSIERTSACTTDLASRF